MATQKPTKIPVNPEYKRRVRNLEEQARNSFNNITTPGGVEVTEENLEYVQAETQVENRTVVKIYRNTSADKFSYCRPFIQTIAESSDTSPYFIGVAMSKILAGKFGFVQISGIFEIMLCAAYTQAWENDATYKIQPGTRLCVTTYGLGISGQGVLIAYSDGRISSTYQGGTIPPFVSLGSPSIGDTLIKCVRLNTVAPTYTFPALITGKVGDVYSVNLYANGQDSASTGTGYMQALQLAYADTIPTGTWIMVNSLRMSVFSSSP